MAIVGGLIIVLLIAAGFFAVGRTFLAGRALVAYCVAVVALIVIGLAILGAS